MILTSMLFVNLSYAGTISSNPNTERGDLIRSVSIKLDDSGLYQVLAKTNLETIAIGAKTYADASAMAADMAKNTKTICKLPSRIRVSPVSRCKFIEVRFND